MVNPYSRLFPDKDIIDEKKLLVELVDTDLVMRLAPLFEQHKIQIDPKTRKIIRGPAAVIWDNPWINTNPEPKRNCSQWQDIVHYFDYIPDDCLSCWKVVARPKTVRDLIEVWKAQVNDSIENPTHYCKCGMEERKWVFGHYGAYWYNTSLEQGKEKYRHVRSMMNKIDANMDVILKRGCTEFELKYGPSNEWQRTRLYFRWQKELDDVLDLELPKAGQPPYLQRFILRRWIEFAYDRGDKTALEFNEGKPFYSQYVTYHNNNQKPTELLREKQEAKKLHAV